MELTEMEKQVLVKLAEKGPLSGYDFHLGGRRQRGAREALMSSSHWIAVQRRLLKGSLIQVWSRKGRGKITRDKGGRRKDLYFLTESGAVAAIAYGANTRELTHNTSYFKKEEKDGVMVWIDECKQLGAERMKAVYEMLTLGKAKNIEELDLDQAKEILRILFRHPKWGGTFKNAVKYLKDVLEEKEE
jgi:hypothetical protein